MFIKLLVAFLLYVNASSAQNKELLRHEQAGYILLNHLNSNFISDYSAQAGWLVLIVETDSTIKSVELFSNVKFKNTLWLEKITTLYIGKKISGGFNFVWIPYTFGDTSSLNQGLQSTVENAELPIGRFPSLPNGIALSKDVFVTRGIGWIQSGKPIQ